ncbi:hemolysin family protein [Mycoplasma sp. T363T]|uniref:Hemolysin family protein n=1 Tax=Mycoplasma bradburyae TaxID=2963128 RepID=A0AAW6HQY5_9MOLU|nr:hemolysin family protein [Mycoplasma bradburyae]MDC4163455.1 hemolysin family protein [Mycoplasma bradburyae]MDC4182056.1 hemolysin family protein [Mycoplasma bradburyae]MDC4182829.1 hemolysin family protein [Mycoplasma bradburyae]MDC4183503.1 hemolysin family protein [Mycoplasma bradburyae]UTS69869.1 hemolysin family protein [Mycoplasma bradburyae]
MTSDSPSVTDTSAVGIYVLYGVLIFIFLLISVVFSASETAFTSLTGFKWNGYIKEHNIQGKLKTRIVNKLIKNFTLTLSTILICNNLANIIISTLSTLLFNKIISNQAVGSSIAVFVTTLVTLFIGEIVPKSIAKFRPIKTVLLFSFLMIFFYYLVFPITYIISKIFRKYSNTQTSEKEVSFFIDEIKKEGVLEDDEALLVKNAINFDEISINQVFVDWKEVTYANQHSSISLIKKHFLTDNVSRIPIVNDENKTIGVLHLKDYLSIVENKDEDNWLEYLTDPLYVLVDYKLDKVLRLMKRNRVQIAIVVNNFNDYESIGIITMEDLLEQLVGQIYDEQDEVGNIQEINAYTWMVDSSINAQAFLHKYINPSINVKKNIKLLDYINNNKEHNARFENDIYYDDFMTVKYLKYDEDTKVKLIEIVRNETQPTEANIN